MGLNRNWTPAEEEYLKEAWGTTSILTIMKNLNRSRHAIDVKARRLGLGPFLEAGDYITFHQLLLTLGVESGGYKVISWVKNRDFPLHNKRVGINTFKVVYLEEFWSWAEKNKDLLDFIKFEKYSLGLEPSWVPEKRRHDFEKSQKYIKTPWTAAEDKRLLYLVSKQQYTYDELSKMLRRTNGAICRRLCDLGTKERPVKADNHVKWTTEDFELLGTLIKKGYGYDLIAEKIGKSSKAVRGRVYSMYLTENLDKARELMGNGNFGTNRPERKIKQYNVMNTEERIQTKDLLTQLTGLLHKEFKDKLQTTEFGQYFQKDMCQNFSSACLQSAGCDECLNYKRISPQACKMCGNTFWEKKENIFCSKCRNMRKIQYLKKRAAIGSRR